MTNTLKVDLYWDLRSTIPSRHTGVGKHIIEVLRGLIADPSIDLRVWVASDQLELWQDQSKAFNWTHLPIIQLPFSNKIGRLRAGLGLPFDARTWCSNRDLLYAPMEIMAPAKGIPFINTIHGIPCFEKSPYCRNYNSLLYWYERIKQRWFFFCCRKRCKVNFVVSDYLKNRLIQDFHWRPEKLHTVYNGADAIFFAQATNSQQTLPTGSPIKLLQVGGANAFDGAPALLDIANYLAQTHPQIRIAIAGDRHEAPWEQQLRALPNIIWLGFLSSSDLKQEMFRSSALLYVPTAESFGIIGVEAMAVGLPILALKSTALPEVLGDAAVWIDPKAPQTIEKGLQETCFDPSRRQHLIELGQNRAKRYQWPNVVEKVKAGLKVLKN